MDAKLSIVSNTWIKQMEFNGKEDVMLGHKHKFDHQTLLSVGKFEVRIEHKDKDEADPDTWNLEDIVTEYEAPIIIYIKKGRRHSIKCLSDYGLGYCIHPIRDGDAVEDIVDPESMPLISNHNPRSLLEEGEDEVE